MFPLKILKSLLLNLHHYANKVTSDFIQISLKVKVGDRTKIDPLIWVSYEKRALLRT